MVNNIITLWTSNKDHQAEIFKILFDDLNMLGNKTKIILNENRKPKMSDFIKNDILIIDIFALKKYTLFDEKYFSLFTKNTNILFDEFSEKEEYIDLIPFKELQTKKHIKMENYLYYYYIDNNINFIETSIIDNSFNEENSYLLNVFLEKFKNTNLSEEDVKKELKKNNLI